MWGWYRPVHVLQQVGLWSVWETQDQTEKRQQVDPFEPRVTVPRLRTQTDKLTFCSSFYQFIINIQSNFKCIQRLLKKKKLSFWAAITQVTTGRISMSILWPGNTNCPFHQLKLHPPVLPSEPSRSI